MKWRTIWYLLIPDTGAVANIYKWRTLLRLSNPRNQYYVFVMANQWCHLQLPRSPSSWNSYHAPLGFRLQDYQRRAKLWETATSFWKYWTYVWAFYPPNGQSSHQSGAMTYWSLHRSPTGTPKATPSSRFESIIKLRVLASSRCYQNTPKNGKALTQSGTEREPYPGHI